MQKLVNLILKIPFDKRLHFCIVFLVSLTYCILPFTKYYAIIFTIIAGFSKELYDYKSYGKFYWIDVLYTIFGGLLMQILIYIRYIIV